MATKIGNDLANTLLGTSSVDYLDGRGGNDVLRGYDANDSLYGGYGDDTAYGGNGDDLLDGQAGHDTLYGGYGNDRLYGRDGNDKLYGEYGNDTEYGGAGNDSLRGGAGLDTLYGESGTDTLYGGDDNDRLYGGGGNDTLYGENGSDTLDGGSGIDWIYGGGGNDLLYFSGFGDHYDGGAGQDTISFQKLTSGITLDNNSWNEVSGSVTAVEKIIGSQYADSIEQGGAIFQIVIDGGSGNDHLTGDQNTRLNGGGGNDTIDMGLDVTNVGGKVLAFGDSGNDTLFAQEMTGGSGGDTFILDYTYATHFGPANANAIIHDFQSGIDHIIFRGPVTIEPSDLTHVGDVWTVHSPDPDYQDGDENITFDVSYTIEGITTLQASDYSFDFV